MAAQDRRFRSRLMVLLAPVLLLALAPASRSQSTGAVSKAAAESCDLKIQALESYGAAPADKAAKPHVTRLSEMEMNSYLAFILKPHFHPSLNSLELRFEEGHLAGTAQVDFDKLEFKSTQFLSGVIRAMLSGVHTMKVRGILVAEGGKGNFQLEEARFDSVTLPNFLVSEIITSIGNRQNPPFDPMKPTALPYGIQKAEVHAGYLLLYQ